MNILKSAGLYFLSVFGAGFLLGVIRIPVLVPRFGVRMAELMEMPVMLLVIFFAARWIVKRMMPPRSTAALLGVGWIALGFVLVTEFTVVLWLQGLTVAQAIAHRDPVSGSAYAATLLVFAMMPMLMSRLSLKRR